MGNNSTSYPAEYNPRVHGAYKPWVYYGPKDTPLAQVKLSGLGQWFGRRSLHPLAVARCVSRGALISFTLGYLIWLLPGMWRYVKRDALTYHATARILYTTSIFIMVMIMTIDRNHVKEEAKHKYH